MQHDPPPPFVIVNPPFEIVEAKAEPVREDDYVIVFTAKWCVYCKTNKVPDELRKLGYRVLIIDVDEQPEEQAKFNVTGLPSYAIIHGRKRVQLGNTMRGAHSTAAVVKYAESFVYIGKTSSHANRSTLIKHLVKDHGFNDADLKSLTASQLDVLHERDHDRKGD